MDCCHIPCCRHLQSTSAISTCRSTLHSQRSQCSSTNQPPTSIESHSTHVIRSSPHSRESSSESQTRPHLRQTSPYTTTVQSTSDYCHPRCGPSAKSSCSIQSSRTRSHRHYNSTTSRFTTSSSSSTSSTTTAHVRRLYCTQPTTTRGPTFSSITPSYDSSDSYTNHQSTSTQSTNVESTNSYWHRRHQPTSGSCSSFTSSTYSQVQISTPTEKFSSTQEVPVQISPTPSHNPPQPNSQSSTSTLSSPSSSLHHHQSKTPTDSITTTTTITSTTSIPTTTSTAYQPPFSSKYSISPTRYSPPIQDTSSPLSCIRCCTHTCSPHIPSS